MKISSLHQHKEQLVTATRFRTALNLIVIKSTNFECCCCAAAAHIEQNTQLNLCRFSKIKFAGYSQALTTDSADDGDNGRKHCVTAPPWTTRKNVQVDPRCALDKQQDREEHDEAGNLVRTRIRCQ